MNFTILERYIEIAYETRGFLFSQETRDLFFAFYVSHETIKIEDLIRGITTKCPIENEIIDFITTFGVKYCVFNGIFTCDNIITFCILLKFKGLFDKSLCGSALSFEKIRMFAFDIKVFADAKNKQLVKICVENIRNNIRNYYEKKVLLAESPDIEAVGLYRKSLSIEELGSITFVEYWKVLSEIELYISTLNRDSFKHLEKDMLKNLKHLLLIV